MNLSNIEETILGTVLAWPETYETINGKITENHFLNETNRHVFSKINECFQSYDEVQTSTVVLKCDRRKIKTPDDFIDRLIGYSLKENYLNEYCNRLVSRYKLNEFRNMLIQYSPDNVSEENISEVLENIANQSSDICFSEGTTGYIKDFNDTLNECYTTLKESLESGTPIGTPTHLNTINSLLGGFKDTNLTILAGLPGSAKTSLLVDLLYNISKHQDKNVLIFSLEMSAAQLCNRIISQETKINLKNITDGKIIKKDLDLILQAIHEFNNVKIHIIDDGGLTISEVESRAKHLAYELKKNGERLDIIGLDYLQLLQSKDNKRNASDASVIAENSTGLKNLAKDLSCPVIALSQFSRQYHQRDNPLPRISDLKGSSSIEQDADEIMFIHRDVIQHRQNEPEVGAKEYDSWLMEYNAIKDKAKVIMAKNRHGPNGVVVLGFREENVCFYDLTNQDPRARIDDSVFTQEKDNLI